MKGEAWLYSKSAYRNGEVVVEQYALIKGDSALELQASQILAEGLSKGAGITHGIAQATEVKTVRNLDFIAKQLPE